MAGLVSVTVGGAALFSLVSGLLNSFIGRRRLMMLSSITFIGGAICCALATNKELLLVGRLINGVGIGLVSATVPVFISEIAPNESRGRMLAVLSLFIVGGQFVAALVGGAFIETAQGWRYMFGLPATLAFFQLIALLFVPESPRWLVSRDRKEEAKAALTKLRGKDKTEEIDKELNSMIEDRAKNSESSSTGNLLEKMLQSPPVRRALVVGCGLQLFQQIIGVNAVLFYSASVIQLSGVSSLSSAAWLAALVASINFIFHVVSLYLVEAVGRRKLTLGSLFGVTVSLALLAASFQLVAATSPAVTNGIAIGQNISGNNTSSELTIETQRCAMKINCDVCTRDPDCGFCFKRTDDGAIGESSCLAVNWRNNASSLSSKSCFVYDSSTENDLENVHWTPMSCPSAYSWMATAGMVIYLAFFACGMGPMPWTINAEIYPSWARSAGNGLGKWIRRTRRLGLLVKRDSSCHYACPLEQVGIALSARRAIGHYACLIIIQSIKVFFEHVSGIYTGKSN